MYGDHTKGEVSQAGNTPSSMESTPQNITPLFLRPRALEEKNLRIKTLQDRLEKEQLERLDLEEELRILQEKFHSHDKHLRESQREIQALRALREDLLVQQQDKGEGQDTSAFMHKLQLQEFKDVEKYSKRLQEEVEELTEEKEQLAAKSHQLTTKCKTWESQAKTLECKVEELQFNLLEREQDLITLKQALQESKVDFTVLQEIVQEKQDPCATPDSPWWTRGENLGNAVTDLKLKEVEESVQRLQAENECLSAEKDGLLQELKEFEESVHLLQAETKSLVSERDGLLQQLQVVSNKLEAACSEKRELLMQQEMQEKQLVTSQQNYTKLQDDKEMLMSRLVETKLMLGEAQGFLGNLRDEKGVLEAIKSKLENELAERTRNLGNMEKERKRVQGALKVMESQMVEMAAEQRARERRLEELENGLRELQEEKRSLLDKLEHKEAEFLAQQAMLDTLTEENKELITHQETFSKETKNAKETISKLKNQVKALKSKSNEQETLIGDLTVSIASLEADKMSLTTEKFRVSQELDEVKQHLKENEKTIHTLHTERHLAMVEQAKLENTLVGAEESLKKMEKLRLEGLSQLQEKTCQLVSVQEQLNLLQSQQEHMTEILSEKEADILKLRELLQTASDDKESLQNKLANATLSSEELQEKLKETQKLVDELNTKLQELGPSNVALAADVKEKIIHLVGALKCIEHLKSEKASLKESQSQLTTLLQSAQSDNQDLTHKLTQVEEKLADALVKCSENESEKQVVFHKVMNLEKEKDWLSRSLGETKRDLTDAKKKVLSLAQENQDLQSAHGVMEANLRSSRMNVKEMEDHVIKMRSEMMQKEKALSESQKLQTALKEEKARLLFFLEENVSEMQKVKEIVTSIEGLVKKNQVETCAQLTQGEETPKEEAMDMSGMKAVLENIISRLRDLHTFLQDVNCGKQTLQEEKRLMEDALKLMQARMDQLHSDFDELTIDQEWREGRCIELNRRYDTLQKQNQCISLELEAKRIQLSETLDMMKEKDQEIGIAKRDILNSETVIKNLEEQVSQMRADKKELEVSVEEQKQVLIGMRKSLEVLNAEKASLERKEETHQREFEEVQMILQVRNREKAELQLALSAQEQELQDKRKALAAVEEDKQHWALILEEMQEAVTLEQAKAEEARDILGFTQDQLQSLRDKLSFVEADKVKMDGMYQTLQTQCGEMEQEVSRLQLELTDLQACRKDLKGELSRLELGLSQEQKERKAAEACSTWCQLETMAARSLLSDAIEEKTQLSTTVQDLRDLCNESHKKHQRIQASCNKVIAELHEASVTIQQLERSGEALMHSICLLVKTIRIIQSSFPQCATLDVLSDNPELLELSLGEGDKTENKTEENVEINCFLHLEVVQEECQESLKVLDTIRVFHRDILERYHSLEEAMEKIVAKKTCIDRAVQADLECNLGEDSVSETCSCTLSMEHTAIEESEYNGMKQVLSGLIQAKDDLENQLKAMQVHSSILQERWKVSAEEKCALESQLESLLEEQRQLQDKVLEAERCSKGLKEHLHLVTMREELEKELKQTRQDRDCLEDALREKEEECLKLRQSLADIDVNKNVVVFAEEQLLQSASNKVSQEEHQALEERKAMEAILQNQEKEIQELHQCVLDLRENMTKKEAALENLIQQHQQQVREEYEGKLSRLKSRMLEAYEQEKAVMMEKTRVLQTTCNQYAEQVKRYRKELEEGRRQLDEMTALCQTQASSRDQLQTRLQGMASQKRSLECKLQVSMERLREIREEEQTANKENKTKGLKRTSSDYKMNTVMRSKENVTTSDTILSSAQAKDLIGSNVRPVPSGTGNLFNCEDEDGEVFDNTYLHDLRSGGWNEENSWGRLSELQRRNTLCLPHLRSCYPAETQFLAPNKVSDNDLRSGTNISLVGEVEQREKEEKEEQPTLNGSSEDTSESSAHNITTASQADRRKWKEVLQTTYKKPGPPTPGKYTTTATPGTSSMDPSSSPPATPVRSNIKQETAPNSASSNTSSKKGFTPGRFRNFLRRSSRYKPQEKDSKNR